VGGVGGGRLGGFVGGGGGGGGLFAVYTPLLVLFGDCAQVGSHGSFFLEQ